MSQEFKDDAAQNGKKASQADLAFIAMMESGTTITENGSYERPLPYRQRPALPHNCDQVERRLRTLEGEFQRDPNFKEK